MKTRKRLSEQEKIDIVNRCKNLDYNYNDIIKEYDVSATFFYTLLRKNGISSENRHKYELNESYFDIIDTEEKAYFLGLLFADGYNCETKGTIAIGLIEDDRDIIEKFKLAIKSSKPLALYHHKDGPNKKDEYKLTISSRHMSQQLAKLGCFQKKSFVLKFPTEDQVPKRLLRHWLRGLWDGNGSHGIRLLPDSHGIKRYKQIFASLVSTENVCESISNLITTELDIKTTLYNVNARRTSVRRLCFTSRIKSYEFIDWLYSNCSVYLDRKYNKYLECKEVYVPRIEAINRSKYG